MPIRCTRFGMSKSSSSLKATDFNVANRYVFPPEASDGVIDLCQDEVPFYFNPYSGELSLEFPRAERNCRGGILA